jgi:hypothetical protein
MSKIQCIRGAWVWLKGDRLKSVEAEGKPDNTGWNSSTGVWFEAEQHLGPGEAEQTGAMEVYRKP